MSLIKKNYCKEQMIYIIIVEEKKRLVNILKMKKFEKKMQEIGIEPFQKKKKKQEGNVEETDTE